MRLAAADWATKSTETSEQGSGFLDFADFVALWGA